MPAKKVEDYRLTPRARRDLDIIWDFTAAKWTYERADKYVTGIIEACETLLIHPEQAPEYIEITPPVRIHRYLSHLIVYRLECDHLLVIRILHMRQNWQKLLSS